MHDVPLDVILEKNKLASTGTWTLLLEVIPKDPTVAHEYYVKDTQDLTYGGQVYTAAAFEIDSAKESGDGEMPTTELIVYDPARALRGFLEANGGGVGAQVKLTPVNTNLLNHDWSNLSRTYRVHAANDDAEVVSWSAGGPYVLHLRVPADTFSGDFCRFHYGLASGGYIGCRIQPLTVASVTLAAGSAVSIGVTGHPFSTGDSVTLAGLSEITPSLDGVHTVTKVDMDTFTLDGTDGGSYSGAYTSGGMARFTSCKRTLSQCRLRLNSARFGGFAGMRAKTLRFA